MNTIILEEKHILKYIKESINSFKSSSCLVDNAKYHHNTRYKDAPNICKYGILSLVDLNKVNIRKDTKEFIARMDDIESHINGKDGVSLSVVGLKDLYPNEDEYNPFKPHLVDFLVSSDIKASRSAIHYGNEFITSSIGIDKIKSVDVRLLKLIDTTNISKYGDIKDIIEIYNYLISIAEMMKTSSLDIPLREMSYEDNSLIDIDRLSNSSKLVLK